MTNQEQPGRFRQVASWTGLMKTGESAVSDQLLVLLFYRAVGHIESSFSQLLSCLFYF